MNYAKPDLTEMMSDTIAPVQARTAKQLVWITVSHPGLSSEGTIGDIIRLRALQRALEAEGWSTRMITLADQRQPGSRSQPQSETTMRWRAKIYVKRIVPRFVWSTLKDLAYRRLNHRFYNLLESQQDRPDLIVDYNFYFNNAALRFARKHEIPIHLNIEGFIADSMEDVPRSLLRRIGAHFESRKYTLVDSIWTVSEPLKTALERLLGDRTPTIHVIPNATDPIDDEDRSLRGELGLENKTVVGFVGGLSRWFSLDQLIDSCHRLRQDVPSLRLMLVGDGPERRRLEEQIEQVGGAEWCTMVGKVAHDEVSRYISCFDVAVITNHKWWTSPLKLLEYGAVGVPVIAPNLPSITSMVEEDEVAVFEQNDFSDFRKKLRLLIDLGRRRQEMGERLKQRVVTDYSTEVMRNRIRKAIGASAQAT